MQPRTVEELNQMLSTCLLLPYPSIIRYPRGTAKPVSFGKEFAVSEVTPSVAIGKAERLAKYGSSGKIAIWSLGNMDALAKEVCELLWSKGIASELVNARFVKPLDTLLIDEQLQQGVTTFVTIEDGVEIGGFGSEVEAYLGGRARTVRCGWKNPFMSHASNLNDLYEREGLTATEIVARICK
jgi:1-deoxy-D-xylulose-5-phosphate synthase